MAKPPHEISLIVTGTAEVDGQRKVYQRTGKGYGNLNRPGRHDLQLRRHVVPTDYRTEAQVRCRARLAAATAAWQALSEPERESWRTLARKRRMTGFNLFVRDFCRARPIDAWVPEAAIQTSAGDAIKTSVGQYIMVN